MVFGRLCPPSAPSGTGEPPGEGAGGGGGGGGGVITSEFVRSFVLETLAMTSYTLTS